MRAFARSDGSLTPTFRKDKLPRRKKLFPKNGVCALPAERPRLFSQKGLGQSFGTKVGLYLSLFVRKGNLKNARKRVFQRTISVELIEGQLVRTDIFVNNEIRRAPGSPDFIKLHGLAEGRSLSEQTKIFAKRKFFNREPEGLASASPSRAETSLRRRSRRRQVSQTTRAVARVWETNVRRGSPDEAGEPKKLSFAISKKSQKDIGLRLRFRRNRSLSLGSLRRPSGSRREPDGLPRRPDFGRRPKSGNGHFAQSRPYDGFHWVKCPSRRETRKNVRSAFFLVSHRPPAKPAGVRLYKPVAF